ncbi:hypothetical protein EV284_6460 [Streptomyces sp. BK022]|uniref:hypothetical protein n=1 Tax=Streptomyces sp. BK022 TaxID=2512123 RepID=UPI0010295DD0|nr:hypothetical protein [Streptomyces sp. BK022]RZU28294.1 hypothetical protein EV284_6460 [Streptomyces sp. BK022]
MTEHLTLSGSAVVGPLAVSADAIGCAAIDPPPPSISIPGVGGRPLVTIHPGGRLEFGDGYRPDEAAQAFWEAVQRFTPPPMTYTFGAPLAARIDAELKHGNKAMELLRQSLRVHSAVHAESVVGHQYGAVPDCALCDHAAAIREFFQKGTTL